MTMTARAICAALFLPLTAAQLQFLAQKSPEDVSVVVKDGIRVVSEVVSEVVTDEDPAALSKSPVQSDQQSGDIHLEPLNITMKESGKIVKDTIRVFSNEEMAKGMSPAVKHFPEHIKYLIWMDQAGDYGESTGAPKYGALPDGLVRVAQPGHEIDSEGNMLMTFCGPGWSWYDTEAGRENYASQRSINGSCTYKVKWDESREKAEIYGFWGSKYSPRQENLFESFTIKLNPWWNCKLYKEDCEAASKVTCPPPQGAHRGDCAMWTRSNKVGLPGFRIPIGEYYAFAVADPDGNPVEPYFSEFMKAMHKKNVTHQLVGTVDHPGWD